VPISDCLPRTGRITGYPDRQPRPVAAFQVGHGALRDDAPVVDDRDRFTEVLDQVKLVAGEQDGDTSHGSFGQNLAHLIDTPRVQAGEGLIKDQQRGVMHERGGELHPLLVAVRQRVEPGGFTVAQAEAAQPVAGGGARRLGGHVVQPAQVLDLVGDGHARVQAAFLGHVAEPAAGILGQRSAVPAHLAAVQRDHAEDRAHRGGLAGTGAHPVPPDQRKQATVPTGSHSGSSRVLFLSSAGDPAGRVLGTGIAALARGASRPVGVRPGPRYRRHAGGQRHGGYRRLRRC
jgi:hypothetical protein